MMTVHILLHQSNNVSLSNLFILGTRNVVAECLGKLCLICPDELLPQLRSALSSPSPLMRTTVVTAMKFTISDQPQPIGKYIFLFKSSALDGDHLLV